MCSSLVRGIARKRSQVGKSKVWVFTSHHRLSLILCLAHPPQEEGIFIVCSGLVRVRYDVWQGTSQTYFLGTGGIFGLFSALTGATGAANPLASKFDVCLPSRIRFRSDCPKLARPVLSGRQSELIGQG